RVEWKLARREPFCHSQFQPPSSIVCSTNQSGSEETSAPSQSPLASVIALMHTSTSPPQYGREGSNSQCACSASFAAVSRATRGAGSMPHSRRVVSDQVVAVH